MTTLRVRCRAAILLSGLMVASRISAAPLTDDMLQVVRGGAPLDVIVEFDTDAVDRDAAARRARSPRRVDDDAALEQRAAGYRVRKDAVLRALARPDIEAVREYRHLPIAFKRLSSEAALRALAGQAGVRALHVDRLHQRVLAESLPLVSQPAVAAAGLRGAGTTVAVIDDGIDLTQGAFGCTAVATPSSCRVTAVQTIVAAPSAGSAHGTNVAAIIVGMAPDARVAALDVFSAAGALTSDILSAIDWAIANRSSLNIVAINMSLGDGTHNTSACSNTLTNPFATSIANAHNAGISVVAAAGNNGYVNGVYTPGLNRPACSPGAISVGAVYDSAQGGLQWLGGTTAQCTDNATATDQVACFSSGASYLTLLAPGALVTAGGSTFGGTSQATPMVSGALATLRASFPSETLAAIEARLTANGTSVTDARTGIAYPRLNLAAAARPRNDDFANAEVLSGASGTAQGSNRLATHEAGEPLAPGAAGQTVWWRWTAPATGQLSLDATGSSVDVRVDVYAGATVGTLTRLVGGPGTAAPMHFQAKSGTVYQWAADGTTGGAGGMTLNWALNTTAQANLSVSLAGPASARPGDIVSYALTVANAGPQAATGVLANVALPSGIVVSGVPSACATQAASLSCSIADLPAGSSQTFELLLRIDSLSNTESLTASLASDVPDPVTGNNTVVASVSPDAQIIRQVPALPAWAALALAAGLWRRARGAGDWTSSQRQRH